SPWQYSVRPPPPSRAPRAVPSTPRLTPIQDLRHHHRDSAGPTLPGTHRVLSSSANPNTDNALPFLIVRGLHRAAAEVPPPPRIGGGGAQGEARRCGHDPPEGRRARARGPTRRAQETGRRPMVRPGRPPRRTASRRG